MSKSSRFHLRRHKLDHTEHVKSDVDKEHAPRALHSHDRPHEQPVELRKADTVKDRARTEE